jgi:hypothetical protein
LWGKDIVAGSPTKISGKVKNLQITNLKDEKIIVSINEL